MPRDDEHVSDQPPGDKWERDEDWERGSRSRDTEYGRPDRFDVRLRRSQMSWIDRQFLDTHMVLIVIVCLCCSIVMLPFGIVGVCTCQVPEARQKAMVTMILSGILFVLGTVFKMAEIATAIK
jgi:hypothetical protein